MTAKVESYLAKRNLKARNIIINGSERVCVNCIWYEQYYRQNRGNVYGWVPTSTGYCIRTECTRGPLRQTCQYFERRDSNERHT